jgi:hypothetical protein
LPFPLFKTCFSFVPSHDTQFVFVYFHKKRHTIFCENFDNAKCQQKKISWLENKIKVKLCQQLKLLISTIIFPDVTSSKMPFADSFSWEENAKIREIFLVGPEIKMKFANEITRIVQKINTEKQNLSQQLFVVLLHFFFFWSCRNYIHLEGLQKLPRSLQHSNAL